MNLKSYLKFCFWFSYFGLSPQKKIPLGRAGKILPAREPHPHPHTAPYPHPHTGVWFTGSTSKIKSKETTHTLCEKFENFWKNRIFEVFWPFFIPPMVESLPRCFWNDREARNTFPSVLVSVAIFNFSILSSSASCECVFSRVGWMVANRRAAITADKVDKRQTLCNQLPQKRRLLEVPWTKN